MQTIYLLCILLQFIIEGATNPPTWTVPASSSITIVSTACDDVTTLRADSGDGSTVLYSLESQSPSGGGFTITDHVFSGGKILTCVQGSITAASYEVVVRATHDGGNGLHADLTLTITFTDVAPAAAPEFVKPSPNTADDDHPIALLETIQAGETVLTLSATDADSDDATLTFNMDASAEATRELFEIAGKELKVKDGVVNDYFDAEKDGVVLQYPIVLEVSDGGSTTTLSTTIDVKDVNDNSPEFSGTFTTEIEANVPEGYTVFTITATDSDRTATNNQVSLSLSEISAFNLDGDKIKVSAGVNFDAKTQSTYTLIVTASDNAPVDPKTSDQDFTVTIKAVTVTIGTTVCTASEVGSSGQTCSDYEANSECDTSASPSVCKCQVGYEANNDNTACDAVTVAIGTTECTSSGVGSSRQDCSDYVANSECDTSASPSFCKCQVGYEANNDNTACDVVTFTIGSTECTASEVGSSGQTCSDYVANSECDTSASPSVCECQVGYEANNDNTACDADISECASYPCRNGGTCTDGSNTYTCKCVPGYDGNHCDNNIDECASNPCQNCGTCYDGIDRYICDCLVGYDGGNCENNILPAECDNSALIGVAVSGWVSFAVLLVVFIILQVRKGQRF